MISDSHYNSRLTPNAVIIYGYLSRRPNTIVTHDELKGVLFVGTMKTISDYVRQIRQKTDARIRSIRGVGYMFVQRDSL